VAGRALGDVVRKLGDRVLPEMIPVLNEGLGLEHSPEMRQGVCLGLAEVLACATKRQLEDYLDIVVDTVQGNSHQARKKGTCRKAEIKRNPTM